MREIFLLVDKTSHNERHDVIVLLVDYYGYLNIEHNEFKLQFQSEDLKDLGYFAHAFKSHNQYKNIPVRLGSLNISDVDLFISQPGLKLNDVLGEALFTENSAELTSSANIILINSNDYVPIYAKAGIIMNMKIYQDEGCAESLDNQLKSLLH